MNNRWVREEIKRKIRRYFELNDNENRIIPEFVGCHPSSTLGKFVASKAMLEKSGPKWMTPASTLRNSKKKSKLIQNK